MSTATASPTLSPTAAVHVRTAVVVEDDPDAAMLVCRMLEGHWGTACRVAGTAAEGLAAVRREPPDLVVLDLMLPDADGYSVCRTLKLDRATNGVPVVMCTALDQESDRVRGFRVGADGYVCKPYRIPEAIAEIARVMEQRRQLHADEVELLLRFDLASAVDNLQTANGLFTHILQHAELDAEEIPKLRTALLELGTNAIEWGNRYDDRKRVTVSSRLTADELRITIEDEGDGFDPCHLPHAADAEGDPVGHMEVRESLGLREGGFGILISRDIADEVRYNDKGNAVTLIKKRRA